MEVLPVLPEAEPDPEPQPATPELTVSGAGTFVYDGAAHAVTGTVQNAGADTYRISYSVNGTNVSEAPSPTEVGMYAIIVVATNQTNTEAQPLSKSVTLTITPAPTIVPGTTAFAYDGTAHRFSVTLQNGEGYEVRYSTDNGSTWSTDAPSFSAEGTYSVRVKAVRTDAPEVSGTYTVTVTKTPVLEAVGVKAPYDGEEHTIAVKLTNGDGYTIEYSIDGGTTWTTTAPKRTEIGKDTVKVRAVKGEDVITADDVVLEVTNKAVNVVTIVNCNSAVNVRKKPTTSSAKLGLAKKNNVYQLLGVEGKWYKIQYTAKQVGYVHSDYVEAGQVTIDEPSEPAAGDKIVTIVNCIYNCNVRAGGSTNYAKIGTAPVGKTYTYLGKSGSYYKIQYTDKSVGYVHKKYAKVSGGSVTPEPVDPIPTDGMIVSIVNCYTDCNVRAGGSQSTALIGTAPRGKTYKYLGTSGSYIKIQYREKTVGYVHKNYAKIVDGTTETDPEPVYDGTNGVIYNCKSSVNVRQSATSSSKLLGTIKKGVAVKVISVTGNWTKIEYGTGTAYVFSKYVKTK